MTALPPDVLAALEHGPLACSNPEPGKCNPPRAFGSLNNPHHHPCCPARLLPAVAAELAPLLAEREAKLAEAVASEGRLRAALVDFRGHLKYIEMKARRLTTGNVSHDGPHIANISEIRRRQVEAALAAPPSRSLTEVRELRAAASQLCAFLEDGAFHPSQEPEHEEREALMGLQSALSATAWLAGPEGE